MVAPPTISAQIRELEQSFKGKLFRRSGRQLMLTELGQLAYGYAETIFSVGRELMSVVKDQPVDRALRLMVGLDEAVPKLVARQILKPIFGLERPVHLICREGSAEQLLVELANYRLDLILTDQPARSSVKVKAFSHPLGECGISFFAAPELAGKLGPGFPHSLHRAPALLPTDHTALRRTLERWFASLDIQPMIVGEFDDSALAKVFGRDGLGFFAVPSIIAKDIAQHYGVQEIGAITDYTERFYAISVERKLKHPAVVAITAQARSLLVGR